MNETLFDITKWDNYIYTKKLELIDDIEQSNTILDKSISSTIFNDILKDIININIFNISYISFMLLKFLELSFIPTEIILNVINIYSDDKLYEIIIKQQIEMTKKNDYNRQNNKTIEIVDTINYINILKFILNIIIEFVVKTELCLNLKCLLMLHFIEKYNTKFNNNTKINTKINIYKPKVFNLFIRPHKIATTHIKSSTLILLFLKLIRKIGIEKYDNTLFINYIENKTNSNNENCNNETTNISNNYVEYVTNKLKINKKTKEYLDTFMIEITNYLDNNKTTTTLSTSPTLPTLPTLHTLPTPISIYTICSNYIINNSNSLFNYFENIYFILEQHLLNSNTITKEKKQKLYYLKNVIKNLCSIEADNIKKLFNII